MAAKQRRGKGEGSIYFNERLDLWVGMLPLPPDPSGKRRRKAVYAKKRGDLVAKLTDAKLDVARGEHLSAAPARRTVSTFLRSWLDDIVKPSVRPNTFDSYDRVLRLHVLADHGIGHLRLRDLKPADLQSFYARMEKRGVGRRTQQLTHAVLHKALAHALRQEQIPRNPAALVDPPRYKASEMKVLALDQLQKLIAAAAGDRLEALYILAVFSGCRQGELLGLQWQDVDLRRGSLQVRRSLQDVNGRLALAETKTQKSRRLIHLPDLAVDALKAHKKRLEREGLDTSSGKPVFPDVAGGYLRRQNILRRSFKPLLKKAKLPDIRFHDLRHSAASMLLSMNIHPKVVQEQLGHSRIGVTLDVYSHVVPALQREAAAKVNREFSKRRRSK